MSGVVINTAPFRLSAITRYYRMLRACPVTTVDDNGCISKNYLGNVTQLCEFNWNSKLGNGEFSRHHGERAS